MSENTALLRAVNGKLPDVDGEAWLAPTAALIGDVHVAAGASIWYGAVLRGDRDRIEIGRGSNIQDGVVVHGDPGKPTIVGSGVSVGHRAVLHGCTIGDNSLIGMSATILNGAEIGAESLVAAGAVVLEGTVVPPRSLVAGVPAKVRRELSPDEIAGLVANADRYLEITAQHAAEDEL
ncbi:MULTISPECIES: gamma carbonic anhydrase family protein [unclassified Salinibacterium]|uniref:gamma carbonic anhydrase family protein n=1 Tax=unclassified Salinibacterium TaxID=2632331 RepID=UPI001420A7EF|nr:MULTISPECIES: gamma carbonic anhydrase family protein [unclassified Salinibacterium]